MDKCKYTGVAAPPIRLGWRPSNNPGVSMRKQELVQLHALCVLIRHHLEGQYKFSADAFHAYDEYGVSPAAIHRRKEIHETALFHILDGFNGVLDDYSVPEDQLVHAAE